MVIDCPGPAAYSVAGRRPEVVVTSGAVDLLTGAQLGAVLAHEHAHLRGRHHRWALAAALVAEAMPIVPLLREAPAVSGGCWRWTRTSVRRTITSRGCWPARWWP